MNRGGMFEPEVKHTGEFFVSYSGCICNAPKHSNIEARASITSARAEATKVMYVMKKQLRLRSEKHKAKLTIFGQIKIWFIKFWIPLSTLRFIGPRDSAFQLAADYADREYVDLHLSNKIRKV